jgi:hypothetical protein
MHHHNVLERDLNQLITAFLVAKKSRHSLQPTSLRTLHPCNAPAHSYSAHDTTDSLLIVRQGDVDASLFLSKLKEIVKVGGKRSTMSTLLDLQPSLL